MTIRDTTAQRIASQWHGGQTSALYALSSSGAILGNDTPDEYWNPIQREVIDQCLPSANKTESKRLKSLLSYTGHYGPRGPQPDWYERVICREKRR